MKYLLTIRSQHSVGSSAHMFGGPDTYVAVQCVPDDVVPLAVLNSKLATKRGIKIVRFGEGYRKSSGPRSMLGRAVAAAEAFIAEKERERVQLIRKRSRYMTEPHGQCARAGYCLEHEARPNVEPCR